MADLQLDLPPGFRFHPTDEEIITHYLTPKVFNPAFTAQAMADADLNKHEPWDLPKRAKKKMVGEKEWYFFSQKDRKYPTGTRTNRATESGYWKATGKDKEIYRDLIVVGMKKTLVFYRGRAPKGDKSNWVMHEYRLHPNPNSKDEWAVCRIFHKNTSQVGSSKRIPPINNMDTLSRFNSFNFPDDFFLISSSSTPPLVDPLDPAQLESQQQSFDEYFSLLTDQKYNNNNINNNNDFQAINYSSGDTFRAPFNPPNHGLYFPNAGAGSQETSISTDVNTEISSVVSRQSDNNNNNGDDANDEPRDACLEDLDCLWDY